MLDSHREVAIPPETDFLPDAVSACEAEEPAERFLDVLFGRYGWRFRDLQVDADAVASAIRNLDPFTSGDALRVVYRIYAAKFGKPRWGDKTPHYIWFMPLIAEVLPEARFIHVIRDGRAVWQSIRSLWFGPNTVEEAASWWRDVIATGRRDGALVPYYVEVRFEELVRDPTETLQQLCTYLELEWDAAMLRSYERAPARIAEMIAEGQLDGQRFVSVAERRRIHARTASPPDETRISAWQRELPPADIAAFETIAGKTLNELGYLN